MNTRIDQSQTNPRGSHQKIFHIEEESKMESTNNSRNNHGVADQEIKDTGYWDIKVSDAMRQVRQRLAQAKTPRKILGGIALGAMLMTAVAFPMGSVHADEAARPMSREALISYNSQVDGLLEWQGISRDQRSPAKVTSTSIFSYREQLDQLVNIQGAAKVTSTSAFSYGEQLDQLVNIQGAAKVTSRSTFSYGEQLDQLVNIQGAAKVTSRSTFSYGEQLDQLVNIQGAAKVTSRSAFSYGEQLDQLVNIQGAAKVTRPSGFSYGEQLDQLVNIQGAAKVTRPSGFSYQEKLDQIRDWAGTI